MLIVLAGTRETIVRGGWGCCTVIRLVCVCVIVEFFNPIFLFSFVLSVFPFYTHLLWMGFFNVFLRSGVMVANPETVEVVFSTVFRIDVPISSLSLSLVISLFICRDNYDPCSLLARAMQNVMASAWQIDGEFFMRLADVAEMSADTEER